MIQFNPVVVLHPDTEIIHPSPNVKEKGCISVLHGYAPTPPGQAAQSGFESIKIRGEGDRGNRRTSLCRFLCKKTTFLDIKELIFFLIRHRIVVKRPNTILDAEEAKDDEGFCDEGV